MTSITEKLTAALSGGDVREATKHINLGTYEMGMCDGIMQEKDRLAPLHLALVEIVKAIEAAKCERWIQYHSQGEYTLNHDSDCIKCQALEKLAEVLK